MNKSPNIEIKAERSTETKETRAAMQISPVSNSHQFDKGLAMTAVGGVTGVKTTKRHWAQRRPPWRKGITTLLLGDSQFPLPVLHLLRLLQTRLKIMYQFRVSTAPQQKGQRG